MTKIKSAMEAPINAIQLNTLEDKQYQLLASNIQQYLNDLFTQ